MGECASDTKIAVNLDVQVKYLIVLEEKGGGLRENIMRMGSGCNH